MQYRLRGAPPRRIRRIGVEAIFHGVAVDGAELDGAEVVEETEGAVELVAVVGSSDFADEVVELGEDPAVEGTGGNVEAPSPTLPRSTGGGEIGYRRGCAARSAAHDSRSDAA